MTAVTALARLLALPILLIGSFTFAPFVFGHLVVREARAPSVLYAVFAPVYVVLLALLFFLLPVLGPGGTARALPFFLVGLPIPAFMAILGGLLASRADGPDAVPGDAPPQPG